MANRENVTRESSASKLLKGLEYRGKKIESVWVEGKGARRIIVFEDGSWTGSNKRKIASLAQIKGTLNQLKKYNESGPIGRRKMLDVSRRLQYQSKQRNMLSLVNKLARAKSPRIKKELKDKIHQIARQPIESPLLGKGSVADVLHKQDIKQHVGDLKNVRWVTLRRGGRYVRIPVEEKRWALKLRVARKAKKV